GGGPCHPRRAHVRARRGAGGGGRRGARPGGPAAGGAAVGGGRPAGTRGAGPPRRPRGRAPGLPTRRREEAAAAGITPPGRSPDPLRIVILGLSITSSWGNGHATTYRGLVRELAARGHDVLFLERDVPWYAENRDLPRPPYGRTELYRSLTELRDRFTRDVREADLVI